MSEACKTHLSIENEIVAMKKAIEAELSMQTEELEALNEELNQQRMNEETMMTLLAENAELRAKILLEETIILNKKVATDESAHENVTRNKDSVKGEPLGLQCKSYCRDSNFLNFLLILQLQFVDGL